MPVYINAIGVTLPGAPVDNAAMENYIGRIHGQPSRLGSLALRQNRIRQRHYALRPDGSSDWTQARLVAAACRQALTHAELTPRDITLLCTASSQQDYLLPGSASLVHHELAELGPIEVASFQSVCGSVMMALKYATAHLRTGEHQAALVGAGEFASRYFRPGFYEGTRLLDEQGQLPMSAEFLRWTLSDGAGAVMLETRPNRQGRSYEVKWIRLVSFADRFAPCMVAGSSLGPDAVPWGNLGNPSLAHEAGLFALKQDFDLLAQMLPAWVGAYVSLIEEGLMSVDQVDWFLCHYSTHSLRRQLIPLMEQANALIPESKWFNNLYACGNTGSASLFVMLEELDRTQSMSAGQQVFCVVPESGQSLLAMMMLEVV